jgi:hypothetical protein
MSLAQSNLGLGGWQIHNNGVIYTYNDNYSLTPGSGLTSITKY